MAVVVLPPLARLLPRPRASADCVPLPSTVVGAALWLEVAVAVDVEEVVRVAELVVVRVLVVAPWWDSVRVRVVVP